MPKPTAENITLAKAISKELDLEEPEYEHEQEVAAFIQYNIEDYNESKNGKKD
jgi:hypothetical protein